METDPGELSQSPHGTIRVQPHVGAVPWRIYGSSFAAHVCVSVGRGSSWRDLTTVLVCFTVVNPFRLEAAVCLSNIISAVPVAARNGRSSPRGMRQSSHALSIGTDALPPIVGVFLVLGVLFAQHHPSCAVYQQTPGGKALVHRARMPSVSPRKRGQENSVFAAALPRSVVVEGTFQASPAPL